MGLPRLDLSGIQTSQDLLSSNSEFGQVGQSIESKNLLAHSVVFHETVAQLRARSLFMSIFVFSILGAGAVFLHALEAAGWAALYYYIGAATDYSDALLHSLGAYSTMGDPTIIFEKKWRLILQIESLTAAVTLGLTV